MHSTVLSTLSLVTVAYGATHKVMVGQGGLNFVPNALTAASGDTVEFHWVAPHHSVVQGSFSNPCQPLDSSAFYSGVQTMSGPVYTVTLNSTDPLYFYCSVPLHCQNGMVGAINAPSGQSADDFSTAAAKTTDSSAPAQVQGGVLGAAGSSPAASSSVASSSSSAAAASSTSSAAAAMSTSAAAMSTSAAAMATSAAAMSSAAASTASAASASSVMAASSSAAPSSTAAASTGGAASNFQFGLLSIMMAVPAILLANY